MIITQDILRRDTVRLIKQIDAQIAQVEGAAIGSNVKPEQYRDESGNWPMIPLLLAKAQAYATLVQLQS